MTVMDLLPTLTTAAGVALAAEADRDGMDVWPNILRSDVKRSRRTVYFASEIPVPGRIHLAVIEEPWKLVQIVHERHAEVQSQSFLFRLDEDPGEEHDLAESEPEIVARLEGQISNWRSLHPMAGTRGTLVPHPGWVPPFDWAKAVIPRTLLQREWKNELPFSKALIDATVERGVLVDDVERRRLEAIEKARQEALLK
jgi:hypothetical protein